MKGIDIALCIDSDIGHLSPLDPVRQGLGPIRVQHIILGKGKIAIG